MKEDSDKLGLIFNILKTKIMASGPITSWEINGETVETVSDFIFWRGYKITADDDWSDLAVTVAEYIMRNTGLKEAQAGIKIFRRNINNLR